MFSLKRQIAELRSLVDSLPPAEVSLLQYTDFRLANLLSVVPFDELSLAFEGYMQDERRRYPPDHERFSSRLFNKEEREGLQRDLSRVIQGTQQPLRSLELDAFSSIGPPYNVGFPNYMKRRLLLHFNRYWGRSPIDDWMDAGEEFSSLILRSSGAKLKPVEPLSILLERDVQSNCGPLSMRSLSNMDIYERHELASMVMEVWLRFLTDPSQYALSCLTGLRIVNAPIGAEGHKSCRVILMVSVEAACMMGAYSYPLHKAMKGVAETKSLYGWGHFYDDFRTFGPDDICIGADTSSQDTSVKYDPVGLAYAEMLCRLYSEEHHNTIRALVQHHHHPVIFSPMGLFIAPVGNLSGAQDTTDKNCFATWANARQFCRRYKIPYDSGNRPRPGHAHIHVHGDDLALLIPGRYRSHLPDDIGQAITGVWQWQGFSASPEKQSVSSDRVLFLKREFSHSSVPIGPATRLIGHGTSKWFYDRHHDLSRRMGDLVATRYDNVEEVDLIANAQRKLMRHKDNILRGILPDPSALWPYYIADPEIAEELIGKWRGPLGVYAPSDLSDVQDYLSSLTHSTHPDVVRAFALLSSLYEMASHPSFPLLAEVVVAHLPRDEYVFSKDCFESILESRLSLPTETDYRMPVPLQLVVLAWLQAAKEARYKEVPRLTHLTFEYLRAVTWPQFKWLLDSRPSVSDYPRIVTQLRDGGVPVLPFWALRVLAILPDHTKLEALGEVDESLRNFGDYNGLAAEIYRRLVRYV